MTRRDVEHTPDGRWIVVDGRRWRRQDPGLPEDVAARLTSHLGRARAAVRTVRRDGTEEELRAAKTFLTGEYPLRFDGNAEIAGILVGMQMIGLPPDYVVNRNSFIEAVTMEDIRRVAGELMDPEGLHVVVVGQPEGLGGAGTGASPAPAPAEETSATPKAQSAEAPAAEAPADAPETPEETPADA